jgi:hypothetical protein
MTQQKIVLNECQMKHIIKTQDNSTTPALQCVEDEEIEQKKGKEERHLRLWATRNSPEAFRSVGSNWLRRRRRLSSWWTERMP